MHRPTISEIEAGNRSVTAEELARFAEIYEISAGWLSGQGAEKLDPRDDRLQLAYRELNKLKPDAIDALLRVLAVMRERSDHTGENVEWTDEKNARRCHLIDSKLQGLLTADEAVELDRLQHALRRHINRVSPLPLEGAKRLHAELLQKQQSKQQ
jgi:hypothetical protein